ncbi:MAG: iron-containing redox enzyme family protein [Acidimicrobiales bacterium]
MTTALQQSMFDVLSDRQLLDHPFYRRWEAGELSREDLTSYAEQYRHFEAMMPQFLRHLSDELEPGAARDLVLANLNDEVAAPSHLELFDAFGAFVGAVDVPASPAMSELLAAYDEVARQGVVASLAGLLAYESQGAAVADSKGAGLAAHYDAPEEALVFWREHSSIEGEHAEWTFDALDSLNPDLDDVHAATRLVGEAWWAFLDERESLAA